MKAAQVLQQYFQNLQDGQGTQLCSRRCRVYRGIRARDGQTSFLWDVLWGADPFQLPVCVCNMAKIMHDNPDGGALFRREITPA